jgi:16S rRNA (adenine1518-N6/adenine1519-N6)-dimethyltransferase
MEVRAKKALGQHFLVDLNAARRIVDALTAGRRTDVADTQPVVYNRPGKNDRAVIGKPLSANDLHSTPPASVLEIGPGMGVLTQYLLQREDIDLKAVELDGESVDYLLTHFPGIQGRLLQADYLRLDLHRVFAGEYRVIGNFPYNISSQIFFKILEDKDRVPEVVCMIQKEVAERIAEKPGSKTYGILSVLLQAWYDIEYLFTVEPGAFAPPPKVRSAVIRLRRNARTSLGCDEKLFKQVVKTAFNQRRKTLRNALKPLIGSPQNQPSDSQQLEQSACGQKAAGSSNNSLSSSNLTLQQMLDLRAERLSVEDFIVLTNAIQGSSACYRYTGMSIPRCFILAVGAFDITRCFLQRVSSLDGPCSGGSSSGRASRTIL